MHRLPKLLLALLWLAVPAALHAADVEIVRVFTGWRDAASFRRVSEYFTGKENTGGITILRTHPEQRAGFYWLVRVKNGGGRLAGARFELRVIPPDHPQPRHFAFPVDLPAGRALFDLGLTGGDWTKPDAGPAAWRLQLLDGTGKVLAVEKSFLWALPEK